MIAPDSHNASLPNDRTNWGRWGEHDEIGTLNLITPDVVAEAARLVRTGRRYGLALVLDSRRLPVSPSRHAAAHFMTLDGGDYAAGVRLPHDMRVADDYVVMPTHWGTHIDALAHVWRENELYNGYSSNTVRSYGATRCGIDKVGVIATRGVLLDVASALNLPRLEPGYVITPNDISRALERVDGGIRSGDAVLVRTGWIQVAAEEPHLFYGTQPGVGLEAAIVLARSDVVLVGADNAAVEPMSWENGRSGNNVVHQHLIRDFGTHLMEMVNLEELARDEVYEFLLVVAPLPLKGGVGSPVNPVALC